MGRPGRNLVAAFLGSAMLVALTACGAGSPKVKPTETGGVVKVLYAASLARAMQDRIGPAYKRRTGITVEGDAGGSSELAQEIRSKVQSADLFISAAPKVNRTLMGAEGGRWVQWYVTFAASPVVLAYNPKSAYAKALKAGDWTSVVTSKGFRLGRTDPALDPMGGLVVTTLEAAGKRLGKRGFAQAVEHTSTVLPEEDVLGRLEAGQVDAAFLYEMQAKEAHLPFFEIPAARGLGAVFTVAVLKGAPDPQAAVRLTHFLLGNEGARLLKQAGLRIRPHRVGGAASDLPLSLRPVTAH